MSRGCDPATVGVPDLTPGPVNEMIGHLVIQQAIRKELEGA